MKIGIIGLGLIGGSIALKLKELDDNIIIYGFDQNTDSIDYSLKNEIKVRSMHKVVQKISNEATHFYF